MKKLQERNIMAHHLSIPAQGNGLSEPTHQTGQHLWSAEETEAAPCITSLSSLLQPQLSCVSVQTEPAVPLGQCWRYFVSCLHIHLQACPFLPSPPQKAGQENRRAATASRRGSASTGELVKQEQKKRNGMKGGGFCSLRSSQEERNITA